MNTWTPICPLDRVEIERGVAALVGGVPVAIFRTYAGELFALDNHDPISGASVLSRGIVGTRGDIPTVASPMHKQAYDLRTGECLDKAGVRVRTWPIRVSSEGFVEISTGSLSGVRSGSPSGSTTASPSGEITDVAGMVGRSSRDFPDLVASGADR
ncbi:MAG: nitrite reductase small subunit NirD [Hamadaea sp.]|nr:nitrite reductase small subunit NirD [Hamadaea sp.]